jgi:hypothetical protein
MKKQLATNSLEMRNLVRHRMAPPTVYFKDRKKAKNKNACRAKISN